MHKIKPILIFLCCLILILLIPFSISKSYQYRVVNKIINTDIHLINSTFLGNSSRNYYGDSLPSKLNEIFKIELGKGTTIVSKDKGIETWRGAGWTGQPLIIKENDTIFIIIGAFDHNLKKINTITRKIVWQYKYDDIIKGTGTIWHNKSAPSAESEYFILQGSRLGIGNSLSAPTIPSYRAISLKTGKAMWKLNVKRTHSYSRDVDGTALILDDTVYIGLENGRFEVFVPDPMYANIREGLLQPLICYELPLYDNKDIQKHGGNLVTESSPCITNNHIYVASGSGHVYGFNKKTKQIDWDFYIGSDIDGSPVVTEDSCLLISIEKQYIKGNGGLLKINPRMPPEQSVVWYFPTGNCKFSGWEGGIIGTSAVNHLTKPLDFPAIAAFIAIDGWLYIVHQNELSENKYVIGYDGITIFPTPRLLYKYKTGPSISTPIIIGNKILAAGYKGIYLFAFDKYMNFTLLDKRENGYEATPAVHNKQIYIASRNGYLYCFGD